ncbi:MAG: GNAT family N-acetyltransferase [Verrucomicrobiota bacterium]
MTNPPVDLHWIDLEDFRFREWVALRQRILRDPLGLVYTEADLEEERGERHLILDQAGRLVGGLAVKVLTPERWKIRQVAVAESEQGRGYGNLLMEHAMQKAREANVEEIVIHAREVVVPFYEKLGFVCVEEPFEEVGIPHRRMEITFPFEPAA